MLVTIVVAMDAWGTLGREGRLPWRVPADLERFRLLTLGKPVVMGRKTWQSLGRRLLLDGRHNFVVTRSPQAVFDEAARRRYDGPLTGDASFNVCRSFERSLRAAAECGDEVCVIGGGEIYRQALPLCGRLHLTCVHGGPYEGDTVFPGGLPSLADWRPSRSEFFGDHAYYVLEPRTPLVS